MCVLRCGPPGVHIVTGVLPLWILYYCDHLDLEALVTWYLPLEDGLVWLRPGLHQQVHLDLLDLYTSYSSVVISAGLVSYACMMYQIFYFY